MACPARRSPATAPAPGMFEGGCMLFQGLWGKNALFSVAGAGRWSFAALILANEFAPPLKNSAASSASSRFPRRSPSTSSAIYVGAAAGYRVGAHQSHVRAHETAGSTTPSSMRQTARLHRLHDLEVPLGVARQEPLVPRVTRFVIVAINILIARRLRL